MRCIHQNFLCRSRKEVSYRGSEKDIVKYELSEKLDPQISLSEKRRNL